MNNNPATNRYSIQGARMGIEALAACRAVKAYFRKTVEEDYRQYFAKHPERENQINHAGRDKLIAEFNAMVDEQTARRRAELNGKSEVAA